MNFKMRAKYRASEKKIIIYLLHTYTLESLRNKNNNKVVNKRFIKVKTIATLTSNVVIE